MQTYHPLPRWVCRHISWYRERILQLLQRRQPLEVGWLRMRLTWSYRCMRHLWVWLSHCWSFWWHVMRLTWWEKREPASLRASSREQALSGTLGVGDWRKENSWDLTTSFSFPLFSHPPPSRELACRLDKRKSLIAELTWDQAVLLQFSFKKGTPIRLILKNRSL